MNLRRALLTTAVHADALRLDPQAFLLAMWWRLLGKKLRSRMVLSPLLARSPRAYRLWLARQEGNHTAVGSHPPEAIAIMGLVEGGEGAVETRDSLELEGIEAHIVAAGTVPAPADLGIEPSAATWFLPVAAGDRLARGAGAIYRAAAARAHSHARIIYADDDLIDSAGHRREPHFKPDWNSELFKHFDFVSGSSLIRLAPSEFGALEASDWLSLLVRSAVELCKDEDATPAHIRKILHHRQMRPPPHRPVWQPSAVGNETALPSICVIIPTRDRLDLLRTCLDGLAQTNYPGELEIAIIDNGSSEPETLDFLAKIEDREVKVLRYPGPFNFSDLNNRAVAETRSELLCFLNNDIEIVDPDWLSILVAQAQRPDVGAVGPALLYPDGRLQHAGVVIGIGGGAAHAHRLLHPDDAGYFHRHALPQYVSAVTAACLVVKRDKFLEVGGFDAENFAVAFNDVDLCLKLNARGWKSYYDPRATLIHHESLSRGLDRDPVGAARFAGELAALKSRWGTGGSKGDIAAAGEAVDAFHHPCLSPFSEQFILRF